MKKQILNLGKALSKAEQRNVFGGNAPGVGEGECKVHVRPSDTPPGDPSGYWTDCLYSLADASSYYSSGIYAGNSAWLVTGYRCASEC